MLRLDPRRPAVARRGARAGRAAACGRRGCGSRARARCYAVTDRGRTRRPRRDGRRDVRRRSRLRRRTLLALARAPHGAAAQPGAASGCRRRHALYPRPVVLTFAGGPNRVRVDAFSGF